MRLARLWLHDFRCYPEVELVPAPGVTAVLGGNGQGKTSLLEAIGWVATTRSFRGVPDRALVREGTERAVIRAAVERGDRERLVEAEISRSGRNRVQVNRQGVPRAKVLAETLLVTVFSPDDLELVKGGPSGRRRYLDGLLAASLPRFGTEKGEYERVLKQRNALLKQGIRDAGAQATLAVWDEQLIDRGARLVEGRLELLERLEGPLRRAYAEVAGAGPGSAVSGTYRADWLDDAAVPGGPTYDDLVEALTRAVEQRRHQEAERRQTLVGPHRDEWALAVGGFDARTHASQGEQRSLALALRLAAHRVTADSVGEPPVLLLDDVFSELDHARSRALVDHLPEGQALVTTASELPDGLRVARRVRVAERRVVAA